MAAKAKAWASHDSMGHWMTLDELMSGARPGRSAKSRRRYEEHKQNLQAAGQTVAGTIARHLEGMWGQDGMALVLDPFPHQVAATHRVLWLRDSCVAPTAWSPQDTLETARAVRHGASSADSGAMPSRDAAEIQPRYSRDIAEI